MAKITKSAKKLKQIAGFLGLFQGLVWMLLSIICIILYYRQKGHPAVNSYMGEVKALMYSLYLSDDGFPGQHVTSNIFIGFMWTYLIFNLTLVVASIGVFNDRPNQIRSSLKLWGHITALICILDLILVILLGVDYHLCIDRVSEYQNQLRIGIEGNCSNGILPVLTIAAKGFVLWIVNAIFAVILLKVAKKIKERSIIHQTEKSYFQTDFASSPYLQLQSPYFENRFPPTPPYRADYPRMPGAVPLDQFQRPFVLGPPPPPRNRY